MMLYLMGVRVLEEVNTHPSVVWLFWLLSYKCRRQISTSAHSQHKVCSVYMKTLKSLQGYCTGRAQLYYWNENVQVFQESLNSSL